MDPKVRKQVLRSISNGIYVVTSRSSEGYGAATLTWLTQTSFEPPLLVAGVRPGSGIAECLHSGHDAVVHIVGADQQDLAKRFFARPEVDADAQPPTIAGLPFQLSDAGIPILADAVAYAECRVVETIDCGGDHNLVILEVINATSRADFEPLTVRESPWEYGG